jgi:hypothetical protein
MAVPGDKAEGDILDNYRPQLHCGALEGVAYSTGA